MPGVLIIQNNMLRESFQEKAKIIGETYPTVWADIIPFEEEFTTSEPLIGNEYLPYGSTKLIRLCQKRNYTGLYFGDNFNYLTYTKNRDDLLNDGIGPMNLLETIEFMRKNEGEWFIKPERDDKIFTGEVLHSEFIIRMLEDRYRYKDSPGDYGLDENFSITIGAPKNIEMEYRCFIVGGRVVDISMYRHRGQFRTENLLSNTEIMREAQSRADDWLPHRNVVMDLCLVGGQTKVVEFNCINASGFYDTDPILIFDKLYSDWTK